MEQIDSRLVADPVYPEPIKCKTEEECKDFVNSGLALEVATKNVLAHGELIKRYLALRQFALQLVDDYNRIATEHNQKIVDVK